MIVRNAFFDGKYPSWARTYQQGRLLTDPNLGFWEGRVDREFAALGRKVNRSVNPALGGFSDFFGELYSNAKQTYSDANRCVQLCQDLQTLQQMFEANKSCFVNADGSPYIPKPGSPCEKKWLDVLDQLTLLESFRGIPVEKIGDAKMMVSKNLRLYQNAKTFGPVVAVVTGGFALIGIYSTYQYFFGGKR